MGTAVIAFVRTWGLVTLLVAAGLAVAYRFVAPAPPDVIRLASGPGDNAYARTMAAYRARLEEEGFRVELRDSAGSVENLDLLRRRVVDVALVQGGVASPARDPGLCALGAVFHEPAWVFVRADSAVRHTLGLRGGRVAMGPEGSGTRVLATELLLANGVAPDAVTASPLAGAEAAEALLAGTVDAAVFVAAQPGAGIGRLLALPDRATLVDFRGRDAAYATVLPFLTPVRLPRSGFSLPDDLPREDVTLMAPSAAVVVREDINPQVATLLLRLMTEVHRGRQLFAAEGRFPSRLNLDLPLQDDAKRHYERGPGFLQSYLPFWVAVLVERLWVLVIPLVTLALPLMRFAPPVYTWQMESRIYRWYDDLRRIEAGLPAAAGEPGAGGTAGDAGAALDALEARVAAIGVPSSYGRHLFALRRDIAYVRARVTAGAGEPA